MASERLFFALWPDAATRADIARRLPAWSEGLDGRLQRPDQWHVTLAFLGNVGSEHRDALLEAGARLTLPPCQLRFELFEHWRKPQVACLVATVVPAPLVHFVGQLRTAVTTLGFDLESRPFRPHVTIARKVQSADDFAVTPPVLWRTTGFALVRSVSAPAGSRYEPVHCWNCGSRGG